MKLPRTMRRVAIALAASGAVSGAVLGATMASASASTIPRHHVKVCAQGNYTAYAKFPSSLGGFETTLINPGNCWHSKVRLLSGHGGRKPIKVHGVWKTNPDRSFYVGTAHYNPKRSGLGIGAEGTPARHHLRTW